MEPDLAYVYSDSQPSTLTSSSFKCQINTVIICWNCNKPGPRSNQCTDAPKKYYFKCGTLNNKTNSYPKYSNHSKKNRKH